MIQFLVDLLVTHSASQPIITVGPKLLNLNYNTRGAEKRGARDKIGS